MTGVPWGLFFPWRTLLRTCCWCRGEHNRELGGPVEHALISSAPHVEQFFFFAFDLWLTCRDLAAQSRSEFTWLPYAGWHSDWYSLPLQVDSFEPKCRPALVTERWTLSHDGLIGGMPACCAVPWANKTPCSLFDVTVMSRVHRLMRTSSPRMMGLTGCLCIGWVGGGGLGGFSLSAVNSGRYLTVAEAGFFIFFHKMWSDGASCHSCN